MYGAMYEFIHQKLKSPFQGLFSCIECVGFMYD